MGLILALFIEIYNLIWGKLIEKGQNEIRIPDDGAGGAGRKAGAGREHEAAAAQH